jgi:hypothetical protein
MSGPWVPVGTESGSTVHAAIRRRSVARIGARRPFDAMPSLWGMERPAGRGTGGRSAKTAPAIVNASTLLREQPSRHKARPAAVPLAAGLGFPPDDHYTTVYLAVPLTSILPGTGRPPRSSFSADHCSRCLFRRAGQRQRGGVQVRHTRGALTCGPIDMAAWGTH